MVLVATARLPAVPKLLVVARIPLPIVELPEEVSVVKAPVLGVVAPIVVLLMDEPVSWKFEPVTAVAPTAAVLLKVEGPLIVLAPLKVFVLPANVPPIVFATAARLPAVPKLFVVAAIPLPIPELPEEVSVVNAPVLGVVAPMV